MIKPHGSDQLNPLYVQDDAKRAELLKEAEVRLIGDKVEESGCYPQRFNARESRFIANRRQNLVTGEAESPANRRTHVAAADNTKALEHNEGESLQSFTERAVATWIRSAPSGTRTPTGSRCSPGPTRVSDGWGLRWIPYRARTGSKSPPIWGALIPRGAGFTPAQKRLPRGGRIPWPS